MVSDTLTPADAAGSWEPRRRLTLHGARARSRMVRRLRVVFVAAAAAAFSAVFVATGLHAAGGGFAGRTEFASDEPLRMVNPRFAGRTSDGDAFQITAEVAMRQGPTSQSVALERPVYRDSAGRIVVAPNGRYDEAARTVELDGQVSLLDGEGNRFYTPRATIDAETNVVRGEDGIIGEGTLGVLRAGAYEFDQKQRVSRFTRGVTGTIPARAAPQ